MKIKKDTKNKLLIVVGILVLIGLIYYFGGENLTLGVVGIGTNNIVPNPSFESLTGALPTGWGFYNDSKHVIEVSNTVAATGTNSIHMKVLNSTKSWYNAYTLQRIPVTPGKKYLIQATIKTSGLPYAVGSENTSNPDYISYGYPDRFMLETSEYQTLNSTTRIGSYASAGKYGTAFNQYRNSDWTTFSTVVTISPNSNYIVPKLFFYTTSGEVWFDDISIKELTTDPSVLLDNGDIEIWTNSIFITSVTSRTLTAGSCGLNDLVPGLSGCVYNPSTTFSKSSNAYSSSSSLFVDIKNATSTSKTWVGYDNFKLNKGVKYEFSAYVKSTSPVKAYAANRDNQIVFDEATFASTGAWQKVSINFVAPANSTAGYKLALESSGSFYVDAFTLKPLGYALACSNSNTCTTTETCSSGYCTEVDCVFGYHAENHVCTKDPISCVVGSHYDANTQGCVKDTPAKINYKVLFGIGILVLIVLGVIFYRRKR